MSFGVFDPRRHSLLRGTTLVLGGLFLAFCLAGFPDAHASLKLLIPLALAGVGTIDTMRCLRLRWSFYHAAVMILLYMDLMALTMILFLLLYPFGGWLLGYGI